MITSTTRVRRTPRNQGEITHKAYVTSLTSGVRRSDTSRQIDPDYTLGALGSTAPLEPPYPLATLSTIFSQSNMLTQCVESYVTNIAMYGWEIVPAVEGIPIDEEERRLLQTFIDSPNADESLRTIHAQTVFSYEKFGHGYVECIRNRKSIPTILRSCPSVTMGVCPKADEDVPVQYDVVRGPSVVQVTEIKKFRIYRQQQGGKFVFFKEFGDPRKLNYKTGLFESPGNPVALEDEATELLHFRQMSDDVYGIPRWIPQLPSILGSREAEEVNLRYFEDNTVPPMILSVAGGRLTGESFRELKKLLNARDQAKQRQNQIMLIEAVPERESLDDKSNTVTLKVDKLTDSRPSDALFTKYDESNQAKIRSAFRLPPVAVGLSQDVTFACYDECTETLTDHGWVSLDGWRKGMKVATYTPATGGIHFEEPQNGLLVYNVQDVSMYRICSEVQDMCVTPQHRMLFATSRDGIYSVSPVEDMCALQRSYVRTSGVVVDGALAKDFAVPHVAYHGGIASNDAPVLSIPMAVLLEWLGYYIADGSQAQQGCAVRIGARKDRKLLRFSALHETLDEHGFRVRVSDELAGTYYSVSHKGMARWFADHAGGNSDSKRIPSFVFGLHTDMLSVLFDALMACDGSWDTREGRTSGSYSTVSPALADDVHRLATLLGYRASVRKDAPGSFSVNPTFRILLSGKCTAQLLTDRHITRVPYTGRVYCFTVSTGVFVTRRNGKVAFQGNTANVSTFVAETQVFGPERTKYDEVWNKRFVQGPNGLGLKTVALRSRAPVVTNPEILIRSLTALNVMGAVTPRLARIAANDILQINLDPYPEKGHDGYEPWMDEPLIFATKTGSGNEGIDPSGAGNTHAGQKAKDDKLKGLEKNGDPSMPNPEHGQE